MWTAAVLNGGRARRFGGRDKSALLVDGETILQRQVGMLQSVPGVGEILLVGGGTYPGTRTIADVVPGSGPLGGIHAALCAARGDGVFVLAGDMPYVSAPLVSYLIGLAHDADLVLPRTEDGYHPLCAVYSQACREPAARRLAERHLKVIDLIDEVRTRVVTAAEVQAFGDRHRLLRNVNTPTDYAALPPSPRHQL
jgi:molybdopterin-guanine dinucleotide biosynthesis protein A